MDKYALSATLSEGVGDLEAIGSVMNMIPAFGTQFQPLGVGGSIFFGGNNLGAFFSSTG